mgnify:CR=1 FL=1
MNIDWTMGLVGGVIIGIAAAVYLLVNGRIMGASGIVGGLVDGSGDFKSERLAFLAGLIVVPGVLVLLNGGAETHLTGNWAVVIIAGLLVGIGTRLANGCSSGHGVCGLSRFSLRGFVATAFYLLAGGLMVVFAKHLLGMV